jgi:hypothetical protein
VGNNHAAGLSRAPHASRVRRRDRRGPPAPPERRAARRRIWSKGAASQRRSTTARARGDTAAQSASASTRRERLLQRGLRRRRRHPRTSDGSYLGGPDARAHLRTTRNDFMWIRRTRRRRTYRCTRRSSGEAPRRSRSKRGQSADPRPGRHSALLSARLEFVRSRAPRGRAWGRRISRAVELHAPSNWTANR